MVAREGITTVAEAGMQAREKEVLNCVWLLLVCDWLGMTVSSAGSAAEVTRMASKNFRPNEKGSAPHTHIGIVFQARRSNSFYRNGGKSLRLQKTFVKFINSCENFLSNTSRLFSRARLMGCTASRVPMVPRPPSLGSDDSPSEAEAEEEAEVRKGEKSKPDNAMETNFDAAAAGTAQVDAQVGAAEAPSTMNGATLESTTSEEGVDARAAVVLNHRADASVDDNDNVNNGNAVETSNAKVEAALPAAASSTDATSDAVAGEAGAICAVNKGGAPLRFMSLETLALPTPEGEGRTLKSTPGGRDGGRANAGPLSL